MSGHTPGPWTLIDNSWSTTGIYVNDSRVAHHWRIGQLCIEQEATEENQYKLEEIQQANARLIAAAPDLLEACKHALTIVDEYNESGFAGTIVLRRLLISAIKKAEGVE